MPKYEHRVIYHVLAKDEMEWREHGKRIRLPEEIASALDELDHQGWQLVTVSGPSYYLRRERR